MQEKENQRIPVRIVQELRLRALSKDESTLDLGARSWQRSAYSLGFGGTKEHTAQIRRTRRSSSERNFEKVLSIQ